MHFPCVLGQLTRHQGGLNAWKRTVQNGQNSTLTSHGTRNAGGAALIGAAPASGAPSAVQIAPGVRYSQFDISAAKGLTHAHLLSVDLANARVRLNLLYPGAVAARSAVSKLANAKGAVAGVNGDFFNISEVQHPGVAATGASVGPAIASGVVLKAAVPKGQRFGPAMPPGVTTRAVLGVGTDRKARLDTLTLTGSVGTPVGRFNLGGLNQYALPVGSIGAFTPAWGSVSRARAVCGTDTNRAAPCSTDTYEVTVRRGKVVRMANSPARGPSAPTPPSSWAGRRARSSCGSCSSARRSRSRAVSWPRRAVSRTASRSAATRC